MRFLLILQWSTGAARPAGSTNYPRGSGAAAVGLASEICPVIGCWSCIRDQKAETLVHGRYKVSKVIKYYICVSIDSRKEYGLRNTGVFT